MPQFLSLARITMAYPPENSGYTAAFLKGQSNEISIISPARMMTFPPENSWDTAALLKGQPHAINVF